MKKALAISIIVFLIGVNVPSQYLSVSWWNSILFPKFGTIALTNISGTQTVSSYPAIQNANNAIINNALNNLIATTTSDQLVTLPNLTTVGTISTGSWNATAIPVNKGGTGTTSPLQYFVMLGDGAYGLAAASSTGTTGQIFTSNGAGMYPSWQSASFDTAQNYSLTGNWNFAGAATRIKNFIASTTLQFNNGGSGISYVFGQTSHAASSTALMEDGSGNLNFYYPDVRTLALDGTLSDTTGTGTTTIKYATIPANTLTTASKIEAEGLFIEQTQAGFCELLFGDGTATSTIITGRGSTLGDITATIYATSTTAQIAYGQAVKVSPYAMTASSSLPAYTLTAKTFLSLSCAVISGGTTHVTGFNVKVSKL